MSIIITLVFLLLISFWVLGYAYLNCQAEIQVKERQLRRTQDELQYKLQVLKQEKEKYQNQIENLEQEMQQTQESLSEKGLP